MAAQCTKEARGGELQVNELPAPKPRRRPGSSSATDAVQPAQNTLGWNAFGFIEMLMTQPMMVVIGQKVGAFGAYCDGMEAYGRSTASKDRQLAPLKDWSH